MNKSKYLKYVLIVAVVGVWGAILYRIVRGLGSSSPLTQAAPIHLASELRPASDTFRLNADYPDPFLPQPDSLEKDTVLRPSQLPMPVSQPSISNVPLEEPVGNIVQFNGVMGGPRNKRRVAIVTVHGKELMVREGEKIEGINIRRIRKNGIDILYKGKSYFLQ
ncbi:MAG TPA: hypothetical protein VGM31_00495 [Puia sp.]